MSFLLAVALVVLPVAPASVPDTTGTVQLVGAAHAMTMVVDYVNAADEHNVEVAVDALGQQIGAYVAQVQADQAAAYARSLSVARQPVNAATASAPTGGGGHSDAWWSAISSCESGGVSGWRTGYFGILDGSAAGSMPYDQQLARARQIWSTAGDGAWGCAGRAYAAVPGG